MTHVARKYERCRQRKLYRAARTVECNGNFPSASRISSSRAPPKATVHDRVPNTHQRQRRASGAAQGWLQRGHRPPGGAEGGRHTRQGCDLRRAGIRMSHGLRSVRKSSAEICHIPVNSLTEAIPVRFLDRVWCQQYYTASAIPRLACSFFPVIAWTPAVTSEWKLRKWPPEN
ncbi:hypothetical protein K466DRAFT_328679 [Polyporus arcularius HHB13444]|uniref:Uncharacterized protein n=1 Tax=Polyporus arcularius HHB13444 TaxID=1314778 RepID=A0A5C3NWP3_9APHY|nr:hypothetical protein K466DRAFT_328679 [Polyporus arcularius HHB13444]